MTLDIEPHSELPIVPLWIDGEAVRSSPPKLFPVHSSLQDKDVFLAHSADVDTAKRAAEAAWTAFLSWKKQGPVFRRDLLLRVADNYERRTEQLIKLQMEETSCTETWARMNVALATETVKEIASRITSISGEIPQMASSEHLALVFREPIGPVLTIAP